MPDFSLGPEWGIRRSLKREVQSQVRYKQEKGIVFVLLNKRVRMPCHQVGEVSIFFVQIMVLVPIDLAVAGDVGMVVGRIVRAVADFKSLVVRPVGADPTQMPFADDATGVTPFSEKFRDGHLLQSNALVRHKTDR